MHETRAAAVEKGLEKARSIASKSPVATTGTKHLIDWSVGRARGGIVDAGLGYTAGELISLCWGSCWEWGLC